MYTLFDSIQLIIYIFSFFIFVIVYKFFKETFASDDDRFNILKSIIIIGMLFSPILILLPTAESETLEDFYSDSKIFELLDINTQYMTHNDTDDNYNLTLNINCTELSSEEGGTVENYKPHKTIKFDSTTYYNQLLLISKLMFNYSYDTEFKIHYYYVGNLGERTTTINLVYQNYISSYLSNNVSAQYQYINDESYNSSLVSQTINQRFSNIDIFGSGTPLTYYNAFQKRDSIDSDVTNIDVRNVKIKKSVSVINDKWSYLTIKPEQLISDTSTYNSFNFIDLLIEKDNYNHTLIIDSINIKLVKNEDNIFYIPFYEYYEFNNISSLRNRMIFNVDFVSNNYQGLEVSNFSLSILSNRLCLFYENSKIYSSNILIQHNGFTGYQITITLTSDNYVNIYLYTKYSHNAKINNGDMFYNWTNQKVEIRNRQFAYIGKLNYYDDIDETYISVAYIRNALKYDIIDREITKIDFMENEQDIIMVKDYDSGGLRIPSIEDIKNVLKNALKPLFSTIESLKTDILKPIQDLISQIDIVNTAVNGITGQLTTVTNTITSEFTQITNTITASLSSLGIDITSSLTLVETAIDSVKDSVDLVTSGINQVKSSIDDMILVLESIVSDIELLYDSVIGEGGIIELLSDMINIISDFFNSMVDLINYLIDTLVDWVQIMIDYTEIAFEYMSNVLPIIPEILGISFSLFAFFFVYGLLSRILVYRNSGDMEDLNEVVNYFNFIISWVYTLLMNLITWITNMIP